MKIVGLAVLMTLIQQGQIRNFYLKGKPHFTVEMRLLMVFAC